MRDDLGFKFRQMRDERTDDARVVHAAAPLHDEVDRLFARHRFAILSVFTHSIEAINDRENPCCQGNRFTLQAVWITTPTPTLMMMSNDRRDRVPKRDAREN